jgi:adenylate cyclase
MLQARIGAHDSARELVAAARALYQKDGYTSFQAACVLAVLGDLEEALAALVQARERGYFVRSELYGNADLEVLRGMPGFQKLVE